MMLPLTIVNTIQNVYKTSHPFPALLWFPTVYGLSASHCFVRQWNGSKRLWLAVCGRLARVDCLRTRVFRSLKHVRNDLSVWVVHPRTRHAMMSLHKCSLASTHTHTHTNPLTLCHCQSEVEPTLIKQNWLNQWRSCIKRCSQYLDNR